MRNIKPIISLNSTLRNAINLLNDMGTKILIVVDQNNQMIGIITDGDIRRALLKGISLDSSIEVVINRTPKYLVVDSYRQEDIPVYFRIFNVDRIPVVDSNGEIVGILFWEDYIAKGLVESQNVDVVITAGGKGTRLLPITKIIPKPLFPIGEQTFIEVIMNKFAEQGFRRFVLILNYKKELIKSYLQERNLPYTIEFVEEDKPLGTVGGLRLVYDHVELSDTVIFTNCDVIADADYSNVIDFHQEKDSKLTIIGKLKQLHIPYGILDIEDGRLLGIREKPSIDFLINTGIYIIDKHLIKKIPRNTFMEMDAFINSIISENIKVMVYPFNGEFFDIGEWDKYKEVINKLSGF